MSNAHGGDDHGHDEGHTRDVPAEQTTLSVPSMDCASCAQKVEGSVAALDGVAAIDPQPTTGILTVAHGSGVSEADITERVEQAGYAVESGSETATFSAPSMDCASCADKVTGGLESVPGVTRIDANPTTATVEVDHEAGTTLADLERAVERAGYEVTDADDGDERSGTWTSTRALATYVAGVATLAGLLLANPLTQATGPTVEGFPVGDVAYLAAVAVGGAAVFRNGYYSLRQRSLDIDLLMSVAILGALAVSVGFGERLYFEAAMLATLFSISELLERYAMDRARGSLAELMELAPDDATVIRDGEEVTVAADAVARGERVAVRPGEKIPRDGVVRDGTSAVNQAPVTGESVPVDKTAGDEVFAGTINEGGYLEIEVTSDAGEDTIATVLELVEAAQRDTTDREQFVERFAGYYTPLVVGVAILLALVPPLFLSGAWETYIVYGLTLLVLACPCAFVISTPVTVVSGITSAARNGVLVKGGRHLETMGDVDAVAFDKTGTLTKGELTVTDIVPLGDNDEQDVLRCARGLERRSEHPIGEAIVARAETADVAERDVKAFEALTGQGVTADLDGTTHYAGTPDLFSELGFDLSHVHAATDGGQLTRTTRNICARTGCLDLLDDVIPRLQSEGKTVVLVGTDEEVEGVVAVADEVRPDAGRVVSTLREAGVHVAMLTGDNDRTARAVADEVGIDDVHASLMPDEKVAAVEQLRETHGTVAMVGDGVNDAPALATADVAVAMGAAGTDTALETADIALMADDLSRLPYLHRLSRSANGIIRQNIWTSLGVKALLAVGVPLSLVPIWAAVLAGDAGMTVGVTGNAMRLAGLSPEK